MAKFVDPLYLKITNPRNTNSGTSIPSAQDLFKGLSVNSQYKVSLGLQRFGVPYSKESESLENHLTACGIFDEYESTNFNYDFFASEAMLPGANFDITEQPGAYQGMLEYNATRRIFPDFEVTFYVDDKYNIIRIFEEWMNFINPLYTSQGKYVGGYEGQTNNEFNYPAQPYYRMQYPRNYKREINITKFERHLIKNFNDNIPLDYGCNPQHLLSYRFIDAFPKQVTAMPVSYQGSQLLQCSVTFGYTRYVTIHTPGGDNYDGEKNFATRASRKPRGNPTVPPKNIDTGYRSPPKLDRVTGDPGPRTPPKTKRSDFEPSLNNEVKKVLSRKVTKVSVDDTTAEGAAIIAQKKADYAATMLARRESRSNR